jgi:hypothetical protein
VIKLFLTFLSLLTLTLSCKQKQNVKHFYVSYRDREYEKADTNIIFNIEKVETKDTTKIIYYCQIDTLSYYFVNRKKDSSKIRSSYDYDGRIRPVSDTTVIIGKDSFNVTEYISNEFVTDGSSIHYFTPQFGVFTTHSGTWPGIRFLQTSDTVMNKKIIKLLKATVPDFFIRGKLANNL